VKRLDSLVREGFTLSQVVISPDYFFNSKYAVGIVEWAKNMNRIQA
jgi:hypothetical protein